MYMYTHPYTPHQIVYMSCRVSGGFGHTLRGALSIFLFLSSATASVLPFPSFPLSLFLSLPLSLFLSLPLSPPTLLPTLSQYTRTLFNTWSRCIY